MMCLGLQVYLNPVTKQARKILNEVLFLAYVSKLQ